MGSFEPLSSMLNRSLSHRGLLTILVVFCLVVLFASLRALPERPSDPKLPTTSSPLSNSGPSDRYCSGRPTPPDTVVIVKTGANEIFDKLPTQLLTALRCYEDLLFFSDLGQQLGPYTIHDALDNVTLSVKAESPEFEYYRTLQEYHKNGQDVATLRQWTGDAAWNLDKFKFLHMLEKTWNLRPNRKWYVYVEADTYLVQSNLRLWLERLDSSKRWYLGSPTYVNGQPFSHGGSGFILSGAALSKFANGDPGVAARYDDMMRHEMFGDYVLMKALKDKGVEFSAHWPMLQAEKPSTLPFGRGPDSGVRHWCQPIVTMHHITPNEANRIWTFEQTVKDNNKPILIKDIYEGLVASEFHAERDDWHNLSDDQMYRAPGVKGDRQKATQDMTAVEKEAYLSFQHCRSACEEQDRCYQFLYFNKECGLSYSYRLGSKRLRAESGERYKSGWILAKIAKDQASNTCSSPAWV